MKGGTIDQRGKKWRWRAPASLIDGKLVRNSKLFNTREEAEAQRQIYLAARGEKNNYVVGLTVRQAFDFWQKQEWADERVVSFKSQNAYISVFNKHILPYVGDSRIDNLNCTVLNAHLAELVNEQNRSLKTVRNIKQTLVMLLRYCKDCGLIDINNEDKIIVPARKKQSVNRDKIVNLLSEEEYGRVFYQLFEYDSMYFPVINFWKNTGIRVEELAFTDDDIVGNRLLIHRAIKRRSDHIKVEDVINHDTKVIVSDYLKTSSSYRMVPLSADALHDIRYFKQWKKEHNVVSEYVFCNKFGKPIDQRDLLRTFHNGCHKAGVPIRGLHSLRKLFCKNLKDAGADWEVVSRIMGHSSIEITKKYYYALNIDDISDIADLLNAKRQNETK